MNNDFIIIDRKTDRIISKNEIKNADCDNCSALDDFAKYIAERLYVGVNDYDN